MRAARVLLLTLLALLLTACATVPSPTPQTTSPGTVSPGTDPTSPAPTSPQPPTDPAPPAGPVPPATPGPASSPTPRTDPPPAPVPTPGQEVPVPAEDALVGLVIVVDPGHNRDNARHPETHEAVDAGGFSKPCNSTGAVATDGYTESRYNWDVATELADALRDLGAQVLLTREAHAGWGPCVDERGRFPGEQGADLMLSVHADGARTQGDTGFHVIAPGHLVGWTEETAGPSLDLAVAVRDALVLAGFSTSTYRGVEGIDVRMDLGTLNWSAVPAVVVETHNMHDRVEGPHMRTPEARTRVVEALATAVVEFTG
jgi:N-acetylmuramoyl-L-alanine amidase